MSDLKWMFNRHIDDLTENRPDAPTDDDPTPITREFVVPAVSYRDDVNDDPDETLILPDPMDTDEAPDENGNIEFDDDQAAEDAERAVRNGGYE